MALKSKQLNGVKWTARIISLLMLIFALPFYFGYGNPLPFANPDYQWIENAWLTLFPIGLIGLAIGWKYPKIGGYLIVLTVTLSVIFGLIAHANFSMNILFILIPGILYLIAGYGKNPR